MHVNLQHIDGEDGGIAVRLHSACRSKLWANHLDSSCLQDLQRHPHLKRQYLELKRDSYLLYLL